MAHQGAKTTNASTFLRVLWIRFLTRLSSVIDLYFSTPKPLRPSSKIQIKSTISAQPGSIELLFYTPSPSTEATLQPAVINFHGGGWVFGTPGMDARWASRVVENGALFVSVGYRLAPAHPFPTPVEDCVDAILWIHANAARYDIDTTKITLSGFSAGGNMVFAAALRLIVEIGHKIPLAGIISFYPLVDRTQTPEMRWKSNPKAKTNLPPSWGKIFNDSYLGSGPVDLSSPYLSPAIAPSESLNTALLGIVAIYTCELDFLLNEGEVFRKRLESLGKTVRGRIVQGVTHAWDRYPTYKKGNPKMDEMYSDAITDLRAMWA